MISLTDAFESGSKLCSFCAQEKITLAEAMIRREIARGEMTCEEILEEMKKNLLVMRESVRSGLEDYIESVSHLSGGAAMRLFRYAKYDPFCGSNTCRVAASAMAVVEVNASMGQIVAAPTAGASGILPGVLLECGIERNWTDEQLIQGLFCAGAVGLLFAENATISGADGGCQAETGVGSAMAAAALVELSGGTPEDALNAAAMTIKNILGLVCDPVAGLVECPCIKRNALGAANALLCADMTLCGINSLIPFDEVVATMLTVGRDMRKEYRETAMGGLAVTPTGKQIAEKVKHFQEIERRNETF